MKPAFIAGKTGIIAHQEKLNTIGNNIANVSTVGFKTSVTTFNDLLYGEMYVHTDNDPLTGYGVKAVSNGINFKQGSIQATASPLDFAIVGDGLFAVENGNEVNYTRNGVFGLGLNQEDKQVYLVTQNSEYVLDAEKQRIAVDTSKGTDAIDYDGLMKAVGIFRFDNPNALEPLSDNSYAPTERSGEPILMTEGTYKILNNSVEQSGTNMTDEMSNLITAQRSYQLSAKVIQTADENEQTINNLRK